MKSKSRKFQSSQDFASRPCESKRNALTGSPGSGRDPLPASNQVLLENDACSAEEKKKLNFTIRFMPFQLFGQAGCIPAKCTPQFNFFRLSDEYLLRVGVNLCGRHRRLEVEYLWIRVILSCGMCSR